MPSLTSDLFLRSDKCVAGPGSDMPPLTILRVLLSPHFLGRNTEAWLGPISLQGVQQGLDLGFVFLA